MIGLIFIIVGLIGVRGLVKRETDKHAPTPFSDYKAFRSAVRRSALFKIGLAYAIGTIVFALGSHDRTDAEHVLVSGVLLYLITAASALSLIGQSTRKAFTKAPPPLKAP